MLPFHCLFYNSKIDLVSTIFHSKFPSITTSFPVFILAAPSVNYAFPRGSVEREEKSDRSLLSLHRVQQPLVFVKPGENLREHRAPGEGEIGGFIYDVFLVLGRGAREIEKEFLMGLDRKIALYFFASKQKKLHFFLV